jgi:hypothetical protein
LVVNVTSADQCKIHGEHIIHNGIRGKLISSQILCKDCGGDYSKDDSAFCKIFAPFMAALKDRLIPADHGKDTLKTLSGSLFENPDSNPDDPSRLVNAKDGVVTPVEPYHEIDGDTITVYAEKHRIDQYINVLAKQLKEEGKDIADYIVEKVTDIHDKGYLAYFFSKDNSTFNDDFKKGIVKIAAEYALHCGVPRDQLAEVLTINEDGKATFDCTNTKMFPFIPTSLFDVLYEDYRYFYEEGYPSHCLRLFSTRYDDGTSVLYCYVDLFSTFQYYVLLNDDYKGDEVNETYTQRLFPIAKPNVSDCDPSDLEIFIRQYGIDMSQCTATTYTEQLRYVQECIRKYPPQAYDLQVALNNVGAKLQSIAIAALCKKRVSPELDRALDGLLDLAYGKKVVAQVEKQLAELTKNMDFAEAMKTVNAFSESVKLEYYRKFAFDVINGEVSNFSIPDYSMKFFVEHKDVAKLYTNAKFSHLGCLCYKPETLE